ncbi:hypothetical protein SAMN05421847_0480 [Halpernia humi]|uniref:Replication-associated protein ORF2/G2P domain-containing protein n=1 Tax=Halpernia humi TaxID=493375 RepID=A0A1H5THZ2_9FLAO|nr:ribosome-binding factor A [Halpernia humi]SEF62396.1 hypothetical protein SAMN05421847_0480 [Halpernia humi]
MSSTKFLKLKKRNLIYYSLADQKRYNEKSKENLVQFQNEIDKTAKKKLLKSLDVEKVDDINKFTSSYLLSYSEIMKKEYKRCFSSTQTKKILDSTNTFVDIVKHNYKKSNGLRQRMITFVTLTIPENQKHTDKILVKTLIDFIDHLKKVKNYAIEKNVETNQELLRLKNYVWRAESTELGNIHFHLLFDTYVNHKTLKRVWNNYLTNLGYENGENAANIHNLSNISDVGGYVGKYLTKDPLKSEFAELIKNKTLKIEDLQNYPPNLVYRRPILYTSWGCSKPLKTLNSPTFSGNEIYQFDELKDKCTKVELSDDLKDYVKIYKGKIYDLLNECSVKLKSIVKNRFKLLYHFIYEKSNEEVEKLNELIFLSRLNFGSLKDAFPVISDSRSTNLIKDKSFIPELF